MVISFYHILGIVLAIAIIEIVGILSVKKVKTANDFSTGSGKAGTWVVTGTIIGTLVGGQSTVGTAQLAFTFGLSAWWFTMGMALGCVVLAIGYVVPLRRSGSTTLLEIVSKEYGRKAEMTGSLLCSLGMFVSIIAQVLSCAAMLMTLFPMKLWVAASIAAVTMIIYVVFGGLWSAGIGGVVKIILLCLSALAAGTVVLFLSKGYSGLMDGIKNILLSTDLQLVDGFATCDDVNHVYQYPFTRGVSNDLGSCISVILGVLATQTYAQAIWSGRSDSKARKGALISALISIPIGFACVLVGMYMRAHYITEAELNSLIAIGKDIPEGVGVIATSAQAFPMFVTNHLPNFLGGIVLGTLLITVIIGGSGLTLGASTILVKDVFITLSSKFKESKPNLMITRTTIVAILLLSVVVAASFSGSYINDLGFLSMGLRTTAVFVPLTLALFFPKRFKSSWVFASILVGTAMLLIARFLRLPIDGMFLALAASLLCCMFGFKKKNKLLK
ncbi:MAG: sodium:solute symporter family protein [Bacteroidales bacterium]|nr:sodium:solute symporter family protein [Bacteroidales bacterium]